MEENNKTEQDKERRSIIMVLAIAAAIIIVVIASYFLVNNAKRTVTRDNEMTYNHYVFTRLNDSSWETTLSIKNSPYTIPFYYNPSQVEDVRTDNVTTGKIIDFINRHPHGLVYISVKPTESSKVIIAGVEIARILGTKYNIFNMNVKSGFSVAPVENTTYPIITCANATSNVMVIMFENGDSNMISSEGNCITLTSAGVNESIKVADAFAFRLLTIMR